MKTHLAAPPGWTSTYQLPSLVQALCTTAAADLPVELNRNTMPYELPLLHVQVPYIEPLELGGGLSPIEQQLQQGLLALLAFSPSPDQPTEEDIGPRLEYNLPD